MKIDFVSDVACPWCAVGLNALETALQRLGPDVSVALHFQPFELNPSMAVEGEEIVGHLTRKYGISAEQVAANTEAIAVAVQAIVLETVPSDPTVAPVWAMPLSAPNALPWNQLKMRCVAWLHKPMAKC